MSSSKRSSAGRHAPWTALALAVLFGAAAGCAPGSTCCPTGPPYEPACSEGFYYYFHGNLLQPSPSAAQMLTQSPWRHMGRVRRSGGGGGTGVLIHANFVLTAAHVVMEGFDEFPSDPPSFRLAQPCTGCLPYGTETVDRIWVPQEWIDNIGGSYDSMETRAYDWAILEVDLPESHWSEGVPEPEPMPASNLVFGGFDDLTPRGAGYACGLQADGSQRRRARPYATDDSGAFVAQQLFATVGGAEGGSLLRTTLEATAGMSGGPVWIEQSGQDQLVGILVGSPQEACDNGENWVAGLSPNTRQRIIQIISSGSAPGIAVSPGFTSGGGGADECEGLFTPMGACPFGVTAGEDAECGDPEAG